MKVLTLFRALAGPRWRLLDSFILPVLETFCICLFCSELSDFKYHHVSGFLYVISNLSAISIGSLSRRWVSRNHAVLEKYFSTLNRPVTVFELTIGAICIVSTLGSVAMETARIFHGLTVLWLVTIIFVAHVSVVRYAWAHFVLTLFLDEVHLKLRSISVEGDLENFKQCCSVLAMANSLLEALPDWMLFVTSSFLVNFGTALSFSNCVPAVNAAVLFTNAILPHVVLVHSGERICNFMYGKRARLRRLWIGETGPHVDVYTALGHGNARGLRWMGESSCINFASALYVLSNVAAYYSLLRTTPILMEQNYHDSFC